MLESVRKLVAKGANVAFDASGHKITKGKEVGASAMLVRGLYELNTVNEALKVDEKNHCTDCQHRTHNNAQIRQKFTTPRTPHRTELLKRKNRTLKGQMYDT